MPKNILITVIAIVVVIIAAIIFFLPKKESPELPKETSEISLSEDISEITDEEIIELLKKNKDSLSFLKENKDFKIETKTVLTKEGILEGKEGPNFKEVYQDLSLEDNRYIKVDLINSLENRGLITVIDAKTKTVPKVFGLLLIKSGVEVKE